MPQNAIKPSPLLVIGMHRSGTTLVCKLLQKMGCFMGFRREHNEESTFFRRLNDSLLTRHGIFWRHPTPFRQLLDNSDALKSLSQEMQHKIHQLPSLEYWGPLLRIGVQHRYPYWGWKDPQMSIVLPVWLELFPHATVIQIVRNGVDVADSLRVRDICMRKERRKNLSYDCPALMENFQLWCDYMEFCETALQGWNGNHLTIRYESLLESPDLIIHSLGDFLGLDCPGGLTHHINSTRKHAFLGNRELLELYQQVKFHPYMVKYNYHNLARTIHKSP